jgi:hypothetical protein
MGDAYNVALRGAGQTQAYLNPSPRSSFELGNVPFSSGGMRDHSASRMTSRQSRTSRSMRGSHRNSALWPSIC